SETFSGRCLCGAVRFEARGRPKGVFWCHCNSCRRHSGAPVNVFVGFENDAVTMTEGAITMFKSSPGTTRGFCSRCGSTLTCATVHFPTATHYPSSGHWASAPAKAALERAREEVAKLLGAAPDEIVFTSGGSEANNLAIKGTYFAATRGRAHMITSTIEHPAVLAPCRFIERVGG